MVTISACTSRKDLKLLEQIPEILHHQDPCYIPPFPGTITKIFSPKGAFCQRHGELFPYIAYKEGKPVGRIAAILNHTHNDIHHENTGFFGFFDFVDDIQVAAALLDVVQTRFSKTGMNVLRGPFNPSINEELGLLVEGFDRPPMVMMPYNPKYYLKIYDDLGLVKIRDLYAFYLSASVTEPERIHKIAERVRKSTGLHVRNVNMKRLQQDLRIIGKIYNETLDRNWGFIPITDEELDATAADLKPIADPDFVFIAERWGEPVAFAVAIPNINELMGKAKSSKGWLRILRFLWYLKTKQVKEARLLLLGVRPQYRGQGIAALFYSELLKQGKKKGLLGGELSWLEETNTEIMKAASLLGGHKYKTYRIFEKPLVAV